jgi:hypothetical protein
VKDDNKAYWAGVWFACGIGMVLVNGLVPELGWLYLAAVVGMLLASFGSWYTAGVMIAALLITILEKL